MFPIIGVMKAHTT